jgi:hypothetical protein
MLTALVVIFGLLWIFAGGAAIVQLFRRKWKSLGIWAGVFVVSWVIVAVSSIGASTSSTSGSTTSDTGGNNPKIDRQVDADNAPAPTSRPVSRQELKRDFIKTVDESISGARIAGNPYKFVGKHVDLHCTVDSVPQSDIFNASCGEDDNGMPVNIVIETDTRELEHGQAVRVIGTVDDPMEGNNMMGGETHFPTVKANFME